MPHRVSSREMQDYVEGRLTKQEVARVEAYLRTNPDDAAKVEKLRQQASRMKLFGKALLREEIPQRLLDAIPRKAK
jgi:anti-sigma factor RsiW